MIIMVEGSGTTRPGAGTTTPPPQEWTPHITATQERSTPHSSAHFIQGLFHVKAPVKKKNQNYFWYRSHTNKYLLCKIRILSLRQYLANFFYVEMASQFFRNVNF